MTANDNLARLTQWTDSVNRRMAAFAETFALEVTREIVGRPHDVHDLESYASGMSALFAAFPGLQFTIDEQLSTGEAGDAS